MTAESHLRLAEVEQQICDITSEQLGIARSKISLDNRLTEKLGNRTVLICRVFVDETGGAQRCRPLTGCHFYSESGEIVQRSSCCR